MAKGKYRPTVSVGVRVCACASGRQATGDDRSTIRSGPGMVNPFNENCPGSGPFASYLFALPWHWAHSVRSGKLGKLDGRAVLLLAEWSTNQRRFFYWKARENSAK